MSFLPTAARLDLLLSREAREHRGHLRRSDRLVPERSDLFGPEREDLLLQPRRVDRFGRRQRGEAAEARFPQVQGAAKNEDRSEEKQEETEPLAAARPEANGGGLRASRVFELQPDDHSGAGGERPPLEPG